MPRSSGPLTEEDGRSGLQPTAGQVFQARTEYLRRPIEVSTSHTSCHTSDIDHTVRLLCRTVYRLLSLLNMSTN